MAEMPRITFRNGMAAAILALQLAAGSLPVLAQDLQLCFVAADRVKDGDVLDDAEKGKAYEACLRALSDTSSITQK